MAEELLSLKWNNHQAHFVDILNFLREKDMFVDATIACGGKIYSAHKFVLSTCSDYFKQIFTRNHSSNPIVFMKDVSCRDIEALLDFMYHGEVNVPQSSLGSLIKTAEGLQIKGLAVPDDPPSGRNQERDKRERDPSSTYLENRSPPPKRRIRERNSPPRRLSNHQPSSHTSKLFSGSSVLPSVEATLDCNDDASNVPVRKSSPSSTCPNTSASNGNEKQHNSVSTASRKHSMAEEEGEEERGGDSGAEESGAGVGSGESNSEQQDSLHNTQSGPGTSGLPHSKQEEMEIKQEDVVDLGEDDDDGDWGGGMGDGGGDESGGGGGGNDSLSSTDNTVNFSDVLLPHTEGALGAGASAGDSAMSGRLGSLGHFPDAVAMLALPTDYFRPHQCGFCGRRFKRKDHKVEHERIHTGERPFICTLCGRSFVQKQQLVGHRRRRHGSSNATSSVHSVIGSRDHNLPLPEQQNDSSIARCQSQQAQSHQHNNQRLYEAGDAFDHHHQQKRSHNNLRRYNHHHHHQQQQQQIEQQQEQHHQPYYSEYGNQHSALSAVTSGNDRPTQSVESSIEVSLPNDNAELSLAHLTALAQTTRSQFSGNR